MCLGGEQQEYHVEEKERTAKSGRVVPEAREAVFKELGSEICEVGKNLVFTEGSLCLVCMQPVLSLECSDSTRNCQKNTN